MHQEQLTVQEQVQAVVAGRIVQKLAKLGAMEEKNLRNAVANVQRNETQADPTVHRHSTTARIPASIVTATLKKLAAQGQIRRVKVAGMVLVARRNATREQLLASVERYNRSAAGFIPKELYAKQVARVGSFEASIIPELGDSSQAEDAYTYEGSVTHASDAETVPNLNNERYDVETVKNTPLSKLAADRIAYQLRIGQGPRNTKRAQQRWMQTDEGQQWLATKRTLEALMQD